MSYSVFKNVISKISSILSNDFTAFKNTSVALYFYSNLLFFSIQQIFMGQQFTFVYAGSLRNAHRK